MDFRKLIDAIDSIQNQPELEAKKEPERKVYKTVSDVVNDLKDAVFAEPSKTQTKYSSANIKKFADPRAEAAFKVGELASRINNNDELSMFLDTLASKVNNPEFEISPAVNKVVQAVLDKHSEMHIEKDPDSDIPYDDSDDDEKEESISSALNNLDSEAVKEEDPKELDFEKDTWPLAGGDFPDFWYCDNCGKAASGGGSCPSCGAERGFGESTEVTEAPMTGMLDADVADVFGSADRFIKNIENSFKDGNVKVEKEPIEVKKTLPNPSKTLRVLWDKEPIKRGNGYWQAIQWADGSVHYVPMADDGTPIWTGEVPNTMRNTYKQKGFGLSTSNGGKYVQKGNVWMTREQDIDNKMKQADADAKATDERNKVYDLQTLYVLNQMGYSSLKAAEQAHAKMSPADQEKMESEFEAGMAKAPTDMETLKMAPSKKGAKGSDADVQAAIELLKSKGYDVSKKSGDLDDPTTKIPQTGSKPKANEPEVISTDIHSEGKKAKPDFLDVDNDKNKKETFKKALKDKEKQKESVNEEVADKQDALKHLQKLMLMPSIMKNKEMFNKIKARYNQLRANESVEGDVQESWFNDLTDVTLNGDEFYEAFGWIGIDEDAIDEAEYQGRKVKLGKPMRGDVKKFKVYVKNPKGNVVKVNFGDPDMKIKKSNPARRKSFRARHNCDSPGPRHKARYWSCRKW